jgi:L-ascorbate metabolism protein UlaG (beta-lactamase superfamily)
MRTRSRSRSRRICLALLLFGATFSHALAQPEKPQTDSFNSDTGEIRVSQVRQMSVVIEAPSVVIYTDPTGGKARYAGRPAPDVILISHEHHEHYEKDTLEELAGANTRLIVPPFVMEQLPAGLRSKAIPLGNGKLSELGSITIEAIPAYGLMGEAAQWHPRGRGNGYVINVDGRRIYIAGSSDATPEMRQLKDIDIALLPLYSPYALGVDDAVTAVSSFKPDVAYIYQYNSIRTRDEFVDKMKNDPGTTTIIARDIGS